MVFAAMRDLVPEFVREHSMADFGRRPLLLFRKYSVVSQSPVAVLKRVDKLGLKEDYENRDDIKDAANNDSLHPGSAIAVCRRHPDWSAAICNDVQMSRQLQRRVTYVQRHVTCIDTANATISTDSSRGHV